VWAQSPALHLWCPRLCGGSVGLLARNVPIDSCKRLGELTMENWGAGRERTTPLSIVMWGATEAALFINDTTDNGNDNGLGLEGTRCRSQC